MLRLFEDDEDTLRLQYGTRGENEVVFASRKSFQQRILLAADGVTFFLVLPNDTILRCTPLYKSGNLVVESSNWTCVTCFDARLRTVVYERK